MTKQEFIDFLGSVYEHSPWVAETAFAQLPFANREDLIFTLRATVEEAGDETKMKLIKAHPDLGGKLALAGKLTEDSTKEQAGLGLDRLSDEEYEQFANLNSTYLEKFGFPFIICAKLNSRSEVLEAFASRVKNSRASEIKEALKQIHLIAQLRVEEKVQASEVLPS